MSISFQIGLWLIGIGLLPGSLAAFTFFRSLRFLLRGQKTSGVVKEVILAHNPNGHSYQPKISFTTQAGDTVWLPSLHGSDRQAFRVGQEVPVVYSPGHPSRARVQSFEYFWLVPMILGIIWIFFILPGIAFIIFNRN